MFLKTFFCEYNAIENESKIEFSIEMVWIELKRNITIVNAHPQCVHVLTKAFLKIYCQ